MKNESCKKVGKYWGLKIKWQSFSNVETQYLIYNIYFYKQSNGLNFVLFPRNMQRYKRLTYV